MTLCIRKAIVIGIVAGIFIAGNILIIAQWLSDSGVINLAQNIRKEFLTGTAITIIFTLLILLVKPANEVISRVRKCPVCDHGISCKARFCEECGSKV